MDHLNREHITKNMPIQRNSSLFTLRYSLEKVAKKEKREKIRTKSEENKKKKPHCVRLFLFGGGWWIRTTEGVASRFTVCPLWPLGKSPIYNMELELVDGFEPPTC